MSKEEKVMIKAITFSKQKILTMSRYRHRTDLLTAILDDKKQYTLSQVDELLSKVLKGKVK